MDRIDIYVQVPRVDFDKLSGVAMRQLGLSARAYHRILKLARTIADLVRRERIKTAHIAEAIQYRPRRREY